MSGFSFWRFLAVLRKEWIQIRRDPMTLRLIMVLPLILAVLDEICFRHRHDPRWRQQQGHHDAVLHPDADPERERSRQRAGKRRRDVLGHAEHGAVTDGIAEFGSDRGFHPGCHRAALPRSRRGWCRERHRGPRPVISSSGAEQRSPRRNRRGLWCTPGRPPMPD